ncbi:hypothetical protein KJ937_02825 [Patescibacteria group bacterium]|nr:hypothetical protein [Patescibacteria group bacterium]
MSDEQIKRPAHELIMELLDQMYFSAEPYDIGYTDDDGLPTEGARRVLLLGRLLMQMKIPQEHLASVRDKLAEIDKYGGGDQGTRNFMNRVWSTVAKQCHE